MTIKHKTADNFFDNIDYPSIIDTVKGIYTSDGSMNTILDFERVLDEADLYAFRNWDLGELVQGPIVKRYSVQCTFMWPYKLMPDPRAIKRLTAIGCDVQYAKSELEVPIEIENYDDYVPGTRYPKSKKRKIWFVSIRIPKALMDDIKEGSIDLAEQSIDLEDIDDAYDEDLDKDDNQEDDQQAQDTGMGMGAAPTAGDGGPPPALGGGQTI
jgi:hypothetical protein